MRVESVLGYLNQPQSETNLNLRRILELKFKIESELGDSRVWDRPISGNTRLIIASLLHSILLHHHHSLCSKSGDKMSVTKTSETKMSVAEISNI